MTRKKLPVPSVWNNVPKDPASAQYFSSDAADIFRNAPTAEKGLGRVLFDGDSLPGAADVPYRFTNGRSQSDYGYFDFGFTNQQSRVALIAFTIGGTVHKFILYPDGSIANLDDSGWSYNAQSGIGRRLAGVVQKLNKTISDVTQTQVRQRAIRKYRLKVASIVTGSVLTVASLIGGGVYEWHVKPSQAAAAARAQYDQRHASLPGAGLKFNAVQPEIVANSLYDAVPKSGGDKDPLTSPRKISLTKSSSSSLACVSLKQLHEGDTLRIATIDRSIPSTASFTIGHDNTGVATACASGPSINALSSGLTVEIAVQIIRG